MYHHRDSIPFKALINNPQPGITFRKAALSRQMIMLFATYFFILFCLQMIMIHLVNYATDIGISPLQAASFISIIGAVSIAGRLLMGRASDKIGVTNSLLICCILTAVSLTILPFITSPWQFILFAVIFGFAYGGEIPQMPLFICHFFGIRAMAALMGLLTFVSNIGGALGAWVGGVIYDSLLNYQASFAIAGIASLGALMIAIVLKRYSKGQKRL
jgi:MFS family permease